MNYTGLIIFTTRSAQALWNHEITGQLSDGMWENARPFGHWKFWTGMASCVGEVNQTVADRPGSCKKSSYDLGKLVPVIGDRMINLGRMAKACPGNERAWEAAEYMPETYEQWLKASETGKWKYDFVAKYMAAVSPCDAADYYLTEYTAKDLKDDLKAIKQAMKSVRFSR